MNVVLYLSDCIYRYCIVLRDDVNRPIYSTYSMCKNKS